MNTMDTTINILTNLSYTMLHSPNENKGFILHVTIKILSQNEWQFNWKILYLLLFV